MSKDNGSGFILGTSETKTDEQILDDMSEILRYKRLAEQAEAMFVQDKPAMSLAVVGSSLSKIVFSPRDVGDMYKMIHRMATASDNHQILECIKDAKSFVHSHLPIRDWPETPDRGNYT